MKLLIRIPPTPRGCGFPAHASEDDIFCLIEILPLNCLKILVGDGRVGYVYIHPSNIQKIN
jgi:hypothetical protein